MDISPFTQYFSEYSPPKKRSYEISFGIIEDTFGECVEDLSVFQRTDLVLSIFRDTQSHDGCRSAASFTKRKACVTEFYKWLTQEGVECSQMCEYISGLSWDDALVDLSQYSKSLEDCLLRIDTMALLITTQDGVQTSQCKKRYLGLKCLVTLLWSGVSCDECISLRKSDINKQSRSISVGDRRISLDALAYRTIEEYATAYELVDKSGRILTLMDSDYLFRTKRKPSLNRYDVWGLIKDYNDEVANVYRQMELQTGISHQPERLDISTIKRNGVLDRVFTSIQQFDNISESQLLSIIRQYAGCDAAHATRFRALYHRWTEYFFN